MKILKAWWSSFDEIAVVFSSDLPFIPKVEINGASDVPEYSVRRATKKQFAAFSSYYIENGKIHFLLDEDNFINACAVGNMDYYVCGDFNGWEKAIKDQSWKMADGDGVFERKFCIELSELKLRGKVGFFKFAGGDGKWLEPRSDAPNVEFDRDGHSNLRFCTDRTGMHAFIIKFDGVFALSENPSLNFPELEISCEVDDAERLVGIYSNVKQGAYLVDGKTRFAIFAPRASSAFLRWWREADREEHLIEARSPDCATWIADADEDLEGARYTWHIDGRKGDSSSDFDPHFPVSDPYAHAMLSSKGPCVVKYESSLPRPKGHFSPPAWHDLVILEAHLRDVLANAPCDLESGQRLAFEGLTKWLSQKECYLRQTGVNCVELQPVQEFTAENPSDYEWGYMPVGWFAPSSSYASDPQNCSQNCDLERLIDAFHKAGIAVILDVVYNHYGEPNSLLRIDKEYYFETARDGSLVNFSGCGNDFRANAPMSKRLILESLKNLMIRYGVDGFRFDLAELLGIGVLKEIERELKKIRPSVILIAEPWSFRGHIAMPLRETGWASWNDGFREFMLSYAKNCGNTDGFKYYLSGSMGGSSAWPAQSVNYLESHDDMCLFDRIAQNRENPSIEDLRRYKLALSIVLLSLGIPMLAEGFDLMRTKGGKNNTYKDGQANALDYGRAMSFTGAAEWLRRLVKFRLSQAGKAMRLQNPPSPAFFKFFESDSSSAIAVLYNADLSVDAGQIFAAFNPSNSTSEIRVGNALDGFTQIADIERFDERGISDLKISPNCGLLSLPPISMGLWIK